MNSPDPASLAALHRLVCECWPEAGAVQGLPPDMSLAHAWEACARALELDLHAFAAALAQRAGLPLAPAVLRADPELADALPEGLMRAGPALPLALAEGVLSVALANPADEALLEKLRFSTPHRLQLLLAPPEELEYAIQAMLARRQDEEVPGRLLVRGALPERVDPDDTLGRVRRLLRDAVAWRASDIHIHPLLGGGVVRMRVDGMLRRVALLPGDEYRRLCNFFQAQGGMDPTNDRVPQDGSLSLEVDGRRYGLHLSTLPARGGERVVIRLLEQDREFRLARNGFSVAEVQALRRLARNTAGLLLMTGPTGSGKTSTLYGLLGEINAPTRSVITIENPVEYVLPGISQVEVNEKAGLDFAAALRSALRQDPNVLLVGEIRDSETAAIAVQAALTGHLVLSTLHTNDALSAIPRLLDLGVTPAVLADALAGVVAQRLCRRLCNACRVPVQAPLRREEVHFQAVTRVLPGYRPAGCAACQHTGYAGRLPIAEIIEVDESLREAVAAGRFSARDAGAAGRGALASLAASAARHIMSGDTSVSEAMRVLGRRFWFDLAAQHAVAVPPEALLLDVDDPAASLAVLLVGEPDAELDAIEAALRRAWFDVLRASTPAEGRRLLKANDSACFVLMALPAAATDAQVHEQVRLARVELAWSRLPAALLLPAGRPHLAKSLAERGATSRMLERPLAPSAVLQAVRAAMGDA